MVRHTIQATMILTVYLSTYPSIASEEQSAVAASPALDPNSDPNLIAWWRLDGDAKDSSGHGLDGRPVGDPPWVQGRIGGAVQLDGVDDYIDCGNSPLFAVGSQLTVACWIKIEAFTRPWETILAKGDRSYRLSRGRGLSRLSYFGCNRTERGPTDLSGKTVLADNRWHHLAGVYDGANMILYVDGREEARQPASGRIADANQPLCIGENAERPERFLKGLVDDVRLYSRALGPEEITALVEPYVEAGAGERQAALPQTMPNAPPRMGRRHWLTPLLAAGMVVLAAILMMSGLALGRREQGRQEKILGQIVQKELLLSLMTFRFAAATVVCVILTAVFVPMLAKDYQERVKTYRDNVTANEADLRTVKVYKNIAPTIFRAPSVLSVFSEGLEKRIAAAAMIELDKVPEIHGVASEGNPYQAVFPLFDASLVFKIVLSILALLAAYDAISGERERGTLKLIFSGAAQRHQVLLGKLLAGLLVLVIPVTLTFLVGLVILMAFPMIRLSASDWGRILLMYVASLLFVSAMYNVGLLFSCLTKRSSISLMLGLFLWILFAVVIPNGSVYLAAELRLPEPPEKTEARLASLRLEKQTELDENAPRRSSGGTHSDSTDSFGRLYYRLLDRNYLESLCEENRLQFPIHVKYADRFWEAERSRLDRLYEQRQWADRLARVSPMSLYDGTMAALAGTDLATLQSFMDAVRAYRAQIVEYVRAKTDNFSAPSFFTPCTIAEAEEYGRLMVQARQFKNPAEAADFYKAVVPKWEKRMADTPSLDLRDFPAFAMPGALGNVGRAIPGLALLALVSMLFFALSFVAFMRYDVR